MYRSVSVLVIGKMMEKLGEIGQSDRGIEGGKDCSNIHRYEKACAWTRSSFNICY